MFADIQIKVIICHLYILFGRIIQKYIPSNRWWEENECTGKLLSLNGCLLFLSANHKYYNQNEKYK